MILKRRSLLRCVIILAVAILFPAMARAGGWASITLDELPVEPMAGEPIELGFLVRQHGTRPMAGLSPTVTFESDYPGEILVFDAIPQGPAGHYTASVVLPHGGDWLWSIQAYTMDQEMPPLIVASAGAGSVERLTSAFPASKPIAGMVIALGALLLISRRILGTARRSVFRVLLAFFTATVVLVVLTEGAPSAPAVGSSSAPLTASQTGQALFVAKGCVTCHVRSDLAPAYRKLSLEVGPNLDHPSRTGDELAAWLANPGAVKPDTLMPDLDLSAGEIASLAEYLQGDS